MEKMTKIYEKISKITIYLLVFLIPIFFFSKTTETLSFNKQILLIFLTFISLLFWMLKSLAEKKISLNINKFNLSIIVFLVILGLSTFFSAYKYGSFWGAPLNTASSFATFLGFALVYFLIVNLFQKKEEILLLLLVVIGSGFLTALIGNFQVAGKFLFSYDFTKTTAFNTVGHPASLGIFTACILVLTSCLILIVKEKSIRLLLLFSGTAMLLLLFMINFWLAWLILACGLSIVLIFGATRFEFSNNPLWLGLSLLLIIALAFGIFRVQIPGQPKLPPESFPSFETTLKIVKGALKNYPIFGSGPGTFIYNYSQFKPEAINNTEFWSARFSLAASDILDKLITIGILGLLAFLGILVMFSRIALMRFFQNRTDQIDTILNLGIFGSWLGITISFFLYRTNFSLGFLFWIFTASFIALDYSRVKTWTIQSSSFFRVFFLFVIISIFGIGFLFSAGKRFVAETNFYQGLNSAENNEKAIEHLLKSIQFTKNKQDNYLQSLAQTYILSARKEIEKQSASQNKNFEKAIKLLNFSVVSAKTATQSAPQNSINWAVLGMVYREIMNLDKKADQLAIGSYKEAIRLEPTNPFFYLELGKTYLLQADFIKQENEKQDALSNALEQAKKAVALKPNYLSAHLQTCQIYLQAGKSNEAIKKLEELKQTAPANLEVAYNLGLAYYIDKQFEKAKEEFERAIDLDENYSNARYFLGLMYDKEGDKNRAIEQFIKIVRLNPNNEYVKKILANLNAGKPALSEQEELTSEQSETDLEKFQIKLPASEETNL